MSLPRPPARLRPKFAALGLVGGAMVCLPLLQLLRYQASEIESVQGQRAALDPAADAVAVQRSLMAHADSAAQVLRGKHQFEPQRRSRQAEVDGHVADLSRSLDAGQWQRALEESRALNQDWVELAQAVGSSRISAAQSDEGHRLRIEQALQVMDLLSVAMAPAIEPTVARSGADGAVLARTLALAQVASSWDALGSPADETARRTAQQALMRQLQALQRALVHHPDPELAAASDRLAGRAVAWLAAPRTLPDAGNPDSWRNGRHAALQALFDLQSLTLRRGAQALDKQLWSTQWQRAGTLLTLAGLALLGVWLLRGLVGPSGKPTPARQSAGDTLQGLQATPAGPESGVETGRLLQRLQQRRLPALPDDAARRLPPTRDAQPSLPPES